MILTDILAGLADIGILGIIIYLTRVHKKLVILVENGGTMPSLIGMRESEVREWLAEHRHRPQSREARDFLERRGRFVDIDPSNDEREQVFPAPQPPIMEQTHNRDAEGRVIGDGIAEGMDS
jgi:hypothetical protein